MEFLLIYPKIKKIKTAQIFHIFSFFVIEFINMAISVSKLHQKTYMMSEFQG